MGCRAEAILTLLAVLLLNVSCEDSENDKASYCRSYACDTHAVSVVKQPKFPTGCRCKIGWAGNGKICGPDKDLDGWPDIALNCTESRCKLDNCPNIPNSGQGDIDFDGVGDACDTDIDNDGVPNVLDNCPLNSDLDQRDSDFDGVKDICDNCRQLWNPDQYDTDRDGVGDGCDDDIDNDGVINIEDNCPFLYNPDRQYATNSCISDPGDDDFLTYIQDNCSNTTLVYQADFSKHQVIPLNPKHNSSVTLKWESKNNGAEITKTSNTEPGLLIGQQLFAAVRFEGTIFVEDSSNNDCIGLVFSYQSSKKFYAVTWTKNSQSNSCSNSTASAIEEGIQIKLINSNTGPGKMLKNALCHTGNTPHQAKTIWKDAKGIGWKESVSYHWILDHVPCKGLIRLKLYDGSHLIVDSGDVHDSTLFGGRLGMLSSSYGQVIWSDLTYKCKGDDDDQFNDKEEVPAFQYKCPDNSITHQANFSQYEEVFLGPGTDTQGKPLWEFHTNGTAITLPEQQNDAGIVLLRNTFYGVDFEGTFEVNSKDDNDFIGFVFGYQNDKQFYVVMWKKIQESYNSGNFFVVSQAGLHIKRVNSITGPGIELSDALWHSYDVLNETSVIWWDSNAVSWKRNISYRWILHHRPSIGLIRVKIFNGNNVIIDSGNVYDDNSLGGKLGVYDYSQPGVIWSDMTYKCNEDVTDEIWRDLPPNKRKILEPVVCRR